MISVVTGSVVLAARTGRGRDGARRAGVAMARTYTDRSGGDKDRVARGHGPSATVSFTRSWVDHIRVEHPARAERLSKVRRSLCRRWHGTVRAGACRFGRARRDGATEGGRLASCARRASSGCRRQPEGARRGPGPPWRVSRPQKTLAYEV